jgi:hypothetical protein
MSKRGTYHITHKDGDWAVKKESAQRSVETFDNKADAVIFGREVAKDQPLGQLIVHKKDGKIQTEYTYGKDPFPPKG